MMMLVGRMTFQILPVYTPQGGRPQEVKTELWDKFDDSIGRIPEEDLLMNG